MGSNGTIGTFVKVYVGRHIAEFPLEKQLKPADFIVAKRGLPVGFGQIPANTSTTRKRVGPVYESPIQT